MMKLRNVVFLAVLCAVAGAAAAQDPSQHERGRTLYEYW